MRSYLLVYGLTSEAVGRYTTLPTNTQSGPGGVHAQKLDLVKAKQASLSRRSNP